MASYDTLPGFEAVYLEDSFVLAVCVLPGEVDFAVDLVLRESHPQYSVPREGEQYCYRRGRVRFLEARQVSWRMSSVRAAYDAAREVDYGGFDQFEVDLDRYVLAGDFGTLEVQAAKCELMIED